MNNIKKEEPDDVIIQEAPPASQQQPSSSSSQRSLHQNGHNEQEYKYPRLADGEEPMETDPSPTLEDQVRIITPVPLRERTRSRSADPRERSRSRERSAELQINLAETLGDEVKVWSTDKTKAGVTDYKHSMFRVDVLEPCELGKAASQRISKYFGYVRYALEAFECGHHVFYSSDNVQDRRNISDYVRRKTLAEYESASRVFIIVRNEWIARQRFVELATKLPKVFWMTLTGDNFEEMLSSKCIISTAEAFRVFYLREPNLFNNEDVFIFEDFQYFGHSEVGHFYEEALLVPPINGRLVFLSPQIANADELSKWICKNDQNRKPVECITVYKRNFAINHFITRVNERSIGQVIGEDGEFREMSYVEATKVSKVCLKSEDKKIVDRQPQIIKLVRTAYFRNQTSPLLIYTFDTEEIENNVNLLNTINLNSEPDHNTVLKMFDNEMKTLSKDDSQLPEVRNLLPFFQRGIAPYHFGMFPFLRQLVLNFFKKGLIKIIVADHSILDESDLHFHAAIVLRDRYLVEPGFYRWISPFEYKEICERVQTVSNEVKPLVVLVNGDENMPVEVAKEIFTNNVPRIDSQLQITPTLILSAIQSPILTEDGVIKNSFERFKRYECASKIVDELREKGSQLDDFAVDEETKLTDYRNLLEDIESKKNELRIRKFIPTKIEKFMDVGRIVKVKMHGQDFGYCVVVGKYYRDTCVVDVIMNVTKESYEAEDDSALRPAQDGFKSKMLICRVNLSDITVVTKERLSLPQSLQKDDECNTVITLLKKFVDNNRGEIDELEIEHLKIEDAGIVAQQKEIKRNEKELADIKRTILNFEDNNKRFEEKQKLAKVVKELEDIYEALGCKDAEEKQRTVFAMIGPFEYYDDNREHLLPKAEFAINCPIKENIFLTELFFKRYFDDKGVTETLFILSTFVAMEDTVETDLIPDYRKLINDFKENHVQKFAVHLRRSKVFDASGVVPYIKSFDTTLCDFLDVWCKASNPFSAAISRTDIRSGFIATYLQRLRELLIRIKTNWHHLPAYGEKGWEKRLQELIKAVDRDIPFCNI